MENQQAMTEKPMGKKIDIPAEEQGGTDLENQQAMAEKPMEKKIDILAQEQGGPDLENQQAMAEKAMEKKIDIPAQEQGGTDPAVNREVEALSKIMADKALVTTAHLAKLLPTGTLLAFQILVPIFSNDGACDPLRRAMTTVLLSFCGLSCFVLSFTDSFKGSDGKIYYGIASPKGLWTFDNVDVPPGESRQFKLCLVDSVHAIMSVMVLVALALYNENVISCYFPNPSENLRSALSVLPIGLGFLASMLFVAFPTTRHGIGYPVTH